MTKIESIHLLELQAAPFVWTGWISLAIATGAIIRWFIE